MKSLLVVLAALFISIHAFSSTDADFNSKITEEWQHWKAQWNRSYPTSEEPRRFQIFQDNFKLAEQRNLKSKGHATHGFTKFSDLTTGEFKSMYLMTPQNFSAPKAPVASVMPKALPASFDWSSKGAVTPVKDQGQCGSCWAFSATETIESVCYLANSNLQTYSEQQIVDCDSNDGGCEGGWPYNAYQYVITAGGIESESDYPYTAEDGTCEFNQQDIECTVQSWQYVTQSQDENAMQNFLYQNSPLSCCVDADIFQTYTGGVITKDDDCGDSIDHCIQVTGWETVGGVLAWTVRNSWGSDWGVNGYCYVQIGYDVCAIAEVVTVPCVSSKSGKSFC